MTDFFVRVSSPPGAGSGRIFHIEINGVPIPTTACFVGAADSVCEADPAGTAVIPPHSSITVQSDVLSGAANPAAAEVSVTVR